MVICWDFMLIQEKCWSFDGTSWGFAVSLGYDLKDLAPLQIIFQTTFPRVFPKDIVGTALPQVRVRETLGIWKKNEMKTLDLLIWSPNNLHQIQGKSSLISSVSVDHNPFCDDVHKKLILDYVVINPTWISLFFEPQICMIKRCEGPIQGVLKHDSDVLNPFWGKSCGTCGTPNIKPDILPDPQKRDYPIS